MRQFDVKRALLAVFKPAIPEASTQQTDTSSYRPESRLRHFQSLQIFLKVCVRCSIERFQASGITRATMYWALRAYQTHCAKHFLLNPHNYFMCRFYSGGKTGS